MANTKKTVRIRERCSAYVDGILREAGEILELPSDEAESLIDQGVAELVKRSHE